MLTLALLLLFLQAEPAEGEAEPVRAASEAAISWLGEQPAAGETVYLRLRGDALASYLEGRGSFRLMDGESELSSVMISPAPAYSAVPFDMLFKQQSGTTPGELQIIIDRGNSPQRINRIGFVPTTTDLIGKVKLERSNDGAVWSNAGAEQLVFWKMQDGSVWDYTELAVIPRDDRYLRVSFPGQSGLNISAVRGWLVPEIERGLYEVPVTLGPMRAGEDGLHIWPLVLPLNNLPLLKLKVSASNAERLRTMNLVRLDKDNNPLRNISVLRWLNDVSKDGVMRSGKWFMLEAESDSAPLAIVVEDGEQAVLQLTAVQAYAGELLISFSMPADPSGLRLEMLPDPGAGLIAAAGGLPAGAEIRAEAAKLERLSSPIAAPGLSNPFGSMFAKELDAVRGWLLPAVYGVCALIALIWGLALLRPLREEN